ncbi:MAG: DUF3368 domain-containing protein [Thermodesulfovibrionales bacterium]|nr:DUF3368 domain-containing protein [Thermodesulfovibrionales bacterium]
MSVVISNSSPLIALASIERLDLLKRIWGEILIPDGVYEEVIVKGEGKKGADAIKDACNDWIKRSSVNNKSVVEVLQYSLDRGEAEVIALGQEKRASLLIIDNREPRGFAKSINMKVIGTIGVIKLAWQKGYITKPIKAIEQILINGFWIDERLINQLYKDMKE